MTIDTLLQATTLAKTRSPLRGILRAVRVAVGLSSLALCAWLAALHPLGGVVPLLVLSGYVLVLAVAPHAWLALVPALLPIASLMPWTGWLYLDEFDLLLLATFGTLLAVPAMRPDTEAAGDEPVRAQEVLAYLLAAALAITYGVALWRGLFPLQPLDANAFASYQSRYNALRVFKGFASGIVLLPFLVASLRENEARSLRLLGGGLVAGLGLACAAALWERLAFMDLLDFASDYRITGSFWEMHTGGAAIDGFLSLTAPFAVWALSAARRPWQVAMSTLLLVATGYVVLVTFTRTTYVAVGGGLALALLLRWRAAKAVTPRRASALRVLATLLAAAAFLAVFANVFATSGYRGLAAVAGVWFLTLLVAPALREAEALDYWKGVVALVVLVPVVALLSTQVPKGPYWAYAVSALATVASLAALRSSLAPRWALVASYALLVLCAVPVATYWGGSVAAPPTLVGIVPAFALTILNIRAARPLWLADRSTLTSAMTAGVIFCAFAVASGSYYMSARFGQSTEDLSGRVRHWASSMAMLRSTGDWLAGIGLGRFPDAYYWANAASEQSGTHRFGEDAGNTYLELSGPRYVAGYGEVYRFAQRVSVGPEEPLVAFLDVRAPQVAGLTVEVCEKHLLYWGTCRPAYDVPVPRTHGEWKQLQVPLRGQLGHAPWYAPRLQFFILTNTRLGTVVDIDNVRLVGAGGVDHLRNGEFAAGMRGWFFTSDHHHLPWHIKNLWLNFLFEQGWVGLLAFTLFLAVAAFRVTIGNAGRHPFAPYLAGGLFGFCVAGMFDTLVDVTRITFLFYLIAFVAIVLPRPAAAGSPHAPAPRQP